MKNSGGDSREMRMSHRKLFAEFERITDDRAPGIKQAYRSRFAGIEIRSLNFPKRETVRNVGLMKSHEMRMNVPAMRIVFVHSPESGSGKAVIFVQLVDRQFKPAWLNWMSIGVEQYNVIELSLCCSQFCGFAMAMAAAVRSRLDQMDIGLDAQPLACAVTTATIDHNNLIRAGPDRLTNALHQQANEKESVVTDSHDTDRPGHLLVVYLAPFIS